MIWGKKEKSMIKIKVGECYYFKGYYPGTLTIKIGWKTSYKKNYIVLVVTNSNIFPKEGICLTLSKSCLEKYCRKIPKLKRMLLYKGI